MSELIQTRYRIFFISTRIIPKGLKSQFSYCVPVCDTICRVVSQMGSRTLRRSDWALFKGSVSRTVFLQRQLKKKKKKRPASMKAECSLKASDLQCTHIHLPLGAPLSSHFVRDPSTCRARQSPAPAAYGSAPSFPCPPVAIPPGLAS